MKVWDALRRGTEIRSFRPFLYRTLNNLIINEYRRGRTVSLDEAIENDRLGQVAEDAFRDDSAERTIDQLDAERLHGALGEIPEQYRVALIMRYINGLTVKEIAASMQTNENVISLRIHRGIKYLRKHFPQG